MVDSVVKDTMFTNLNSFYKKNTSRGDTVKYGDTITLMSIDVSYNNTTQDNYFLYKDDSISSSTIKVAPQNLTRNSFLGGNRYSGYQFMLYDASASTDTGTIGGTVTYGDWNITIKNQAMANDAGYMGGWGSATNQWGKWNWAKNVSNGAQWHFSPVSIPWDNTSPVCYGDVIQMTTVWTDGKKGADNVLISAWTPCNPGSLGGCDRSKLTQDGALSGTGITLARPDPFYAFHNKGNSWISGMEMNFPLPSDSPNETHTGVTWDQSQPPGPENTFWVICRGDGVSPYDTNVTNRIQNIMDYCGEKNSEHEFVLTYTTTPTCRGGLDTCIGFNEVTDTAYAGRDLYSNNVLCNNTISDLNNYCNTKCGRNSDGTGGTIGACDDDKECSCLDYRNSTLYDQTYSFLSTDPSVNSSQSSTIQNNTARNFVDQPAKCWFPGCGTSDATPATNGFISGDNTTLFTPTAWSSAGTGCPAGTDCNSLDLQICNSLNVKTGDNPQIGEIYNKLNCTQNVPISGGGGGGITPPSPSPGSGSGPIRQGSKINVDLIIGVSGGVLILIIAIILLLIL